MRLFILQLSFDELLNCIDRRKRREERLEPLMAKTILKIVVPRFYPHLNCVTTKAKANGLGEQGGMKTGQTECRQIAFM